MRKKKYETSLFFPVRLFGLSKDQPNPDQIFYVQFKFLACGLNLKLFKGVQYIWIMLLTETGIHLCSSVYVVF